MKSFVWEISCHSIQAGAHEGVPRHFPSSWYLRWTRWATGSLAPLFGSDQNNIKSLSIRSFQSACAHAHTLQTLNPKLSTRNCLFPGCNRKNTDNLDMQKLILVPQLRRAVTSMCSWRSSEGFFGGGLLFNLRTAFCQVKVFERDFANGCRPLLPCADQCQELFVQSVQISR